MERWAEFEKQLNVAAPTFAPASFSAQRHTEKPLSKGDEVIVQEAKKKAKQEAKEKAKQEAKKKAKQEAKEKAEEEAKEKAEQENIALSKRRLLLSDQAELQADLKQAAMEVAMKKAATQVLLEEMGVSRAKAVKQQQAENLLEEKAKSARPLLPRLKRRLTKNCRKRSQQWRLQLKQWRL
jgi:membrane protein involved in colicin uptake